MQPEADAALAHQRGLALAQYQAGFLANTSHELRSPFNQIISLHQLILEDLCEGPEEERQFLAQAQEAITRVLKNLDLLISVSKLEIGRLEPDLQPVSLAEVFSQVKKLLEMPAANRSCRLTLTEPDKTLYGYGDPQWLQLALLLLGEGAIAAGSSQLRLQVQSTDPNTLVILLEYEGSPEIWQTASAQPVQWQPVPDGPGQGFSLPFRWQVAAQILNKIGGQIRLAGAVPDPSETDPKNQALAGLTIALKRCTDADLA